MSISAFNYFISLLFWQKIQRKKNLLVNVTFIFLESNKILTFTFSSSIFYPWFVTTSCWRTYHVHVSCIIYILYTFLSKSISSLLLHMFSMHSNRHINYKVLQTEGIVIIYQSSLDYSDLRNTKCIPVFGSCDPNTRDVARLEKSVKRKSRAARRVFLAFRKSSNIPNVWITVSKQGNPFGISFIK